MRNFRVLVKKLFYGNEIQFQVSKFGKTLHINVSLDKEERSFCEMVMSNVISECSD